MLVNIFERDRQKFLYYLVVAYTFIKNNSFGGIFHKFRPNVSEQLFSRVSLGGSFIGKEVYAQENVN